MSEEKFKILIADDDLDLRELLIEAVRNWGYEVSLARDGEEALKKLRMDHFHMVITDLMMPGMDGLQLLQRIRELDGDILVIIIASYATIETAVKAMQSARTTIAKPFRLDELMIVIKNACERLRLMLQNRNLLEELRTAYGEIAVLKKALGTGAEAQGYGRDREALAEAAHKDGPNPLKYQEYMREADRFSKKTAPKT
ncbi:MAG: response regulator [Deltaproteobacteria bacterium]|nr:response regulator [Deltaproteobacteria bacterium]